MVGRGHGPHGCRFFERRLPPAPTRSLRSEMPSRSRRRSILRRLVPAALAGVLAGPTTWSGATSAAPAFARFEPWLIESPAPARAAGKAARTGRTFGLDDAGAIRAVETPEVSADGRTIAYVVRAADMAADRQHSAIWIAS